MLESLLDNLTTGRLEIDMIEFSGIEFRRVDNRVMSLRLVQLGLSGVAIFKSSGEVLQPSEVPHKRPILVERGRIKQLRNFAEGALHIFSRDVLKRMKDQDACWEEMVPAEVAQVIKRRRFFGYSEAAAPGGNL